MNRIRLFFHKIQSISGSDGLSVVTLVDSNKSRALNFICDKAATEQFNIRIERAGQTSTFLPEVLLSFIDAEKDGGFEINIHNVSNGEYMTSVLCSSQLKVRDIRLSDAVLLSILLKVPIFIERTLYEKQSTEYSLIRKTINIPINTLCIDRLTHELNTAISVENYRLAAILAKEIKKRKKK